MPKKVTEILSNLFSTNKSPPSTVATTTSRAITAPIDDVQLECDAAPLDDMYERSLGAKSEVNKINTTLTQTSTTTTATTTTGGRRPSASSSATTTADQHSIGGSNQLRRQNSAPVTGSNSPATALTRSATAPDTKSLEPHQMPALDIVLPSPSVMAPSCQQQQPPSQPMCVNNTQGYNVYQFSQISGLHIGSVYNIAHGQSETGKAESARQAIVDGLEGGHSAYRKTKTVDAMMRSKARLQHRHMDIVSTHLGEGWRDIIRLLGFSEGQIEQMYEDNFARGIKEVIYNFLLDYTRNDEQASVGHLTRLLWKAGRRECVVLLKEYWKGTRDAHEGDESMSSLKEETDESVS